VKKVLNFLPAALVVFPTCALAHHPMGGATPSTLLEGLLSGVGHPVIGLDHLAFVIGVGVAAWLVGGRYVAPLIFIIAAMVGAGLHLAAIDLPIVEVVIAVSVAAIGLMLMSVREFGIGAYGALFASAGLFHGHAYGEAVFGAETTPIIAYLAGFALIQYIIAIAAGFVVCNLIGKRGGAVNNTASRLAGGMVAGAGGLLIGEHALAALGLG
jgi:urease accessory protein